MKYQYNYPRPSVTVDIIVFDLDQRQILLIKRKHSPFANKWALPGGFVDANEQLDKAAYRELQEETKIKNIKLKQFMSFGDPGRDPRGHTISIVYWGNFNSLNEIIAGDDAKNADWFEFENLPELAFDHKEIINIALKTLF